MTPELRNLPHIASMAFNEPLLLEPAYARVFFCALAGQMGITRLTDAVSGISLDAGQMAEPLALFGDDEDAEPRPVRSYQVTNGIAVLPCIGHARQQNPFPAALLRHDGVQRHCCPSSAGHE